MPESPSAVFARLNATSGPPHPPMLFERVVVLGASVAGLLAARVPFEDQHAKRVVILERDDPDAEAGGRPGVPHEMQVHALLPGGQAQLTRWFPGLAAQAEQAGAVLSESTATASYIDGVRQVRTNHPPLLSASRPLLESLVRRRTTELPNVEPHRARAVGLRFDGDAVTGVRDENGDTWDADFVVDAMGRSSRLPEWLKREGWPVPRQERLPVMVNYATAYFSRSDQRPRIGTAVARFGPRVRSDGLAGAAVSAVDQDRWIAMLCGYGDARPGSDPADFVARCRELPDVFRVATSGRAVSDVRTFHLADSRRRDYVDIERFPARLVSVGDAAASFNQVYGQGMSSAALHASALSEYLNSAPVPSSPARHFFALQKVVVDAAWATSTTTDREPGNAPWRERIQRWVGDQILAAAITDPVVASRLESVAFMLTHPVDLATPGTAVRAILANARNALTRSRRTATAEPSGDGTHTRVP